MTEYKHRNLIGTPYAPVWLDYIKAIIFVAIMLTGAYYFSEFVEHAADVMESNPGPGL